MVEVRVPHAQRGVPQQGFRKTKVANNGYKIVYIHLNDPLLLEHQKRLVQPKRRVQGLHGSSTSAALPFVALRDMKGAIGSRGCSPLAGFDFHNLLSSISEQTTFLRLLIDGQEAVRFDRQVASSLATLLLLGAIKVSWASRGVFRSGTALMRLSACLAYYCSYPQSCFPAALSAILTRAI